MMPASQACAHRIGCPQGCHCNGAVWAACQGNGVEKSAKPEHNLQQVEDFASRLAILEYGNKAAAHYGDIRAVLERKGTPIGVNDLRIASHARSERRKLVTNKFERVAGLRLENWI